MIGPLLACGLGDAYGRGFEFASGVYVRKHNQMTGYLPHPKWGNADVGRYSDDTQMALGLVEHMLADDPWTPLNLANRWVNGFHRDPHTGYAQHFYDFLIAHPTGVMFLADILPHSSKNGGAMRAFPCGFLRDPIEVRDKAMFQASLTHASYEGMQAAAAAALMFHFCYHRVGPLDTELGLFLNQWLPGTDWMMGTHPRGAPTGGVPTVQKAIAVLCRCQSLTDALQMAVGLGGDTDTIAAIVAPSAAVCDGVRNILPPIFNDGLENGTYGRDYLRDIDRQLEVKFPRGTALVVSPQPKSRRKSEPEPKGKGPLDFLFEE